MNAPPEKGTAPISAKESRPKGEDSTQRISYWSVPGKANCDQWSVFNSREEKLLTLALDRAAEPGEVGNAARMLIESLRRRGLRPDEVIRGTDVPEPAKPPAFDVGSVTMPWGKYQGKRLREIPFKYLCFVLRKCVNADPILLNAIRNYLRQVYRG